MPVGAGMGWRQSLRTTGPDRPIPFANGHMAVVQMWLLFLIRMELLRTDSHGSKT